MTWILSITIIIAAAVIIFLKVPGSVTKSNFQNDVCSYEKRFSQKDARMTEQEIVGLPEPVQTHLRVSGCLGKERMSAVKAYITSAPLREANHKPPMMVDYTLCSFADEPVRLAYIKTSIFGIPFEAYDSTQNGVGFMRGVLGKVITLFHQTGAEMDQAQLLTYLGECFLIPSAILGSNITWESIDGTHARAFISYKGVTGSGIFTFGEQGLVQSFRTDQRARIGNDGSVDYPEWSFVYGEFQEEGGMFYPARLQTIWHDREGDLLYFDADDIKYVYGGSGQLESG